MTARASAVRTAAKMTMPHAMVHNPRDGALQSVRTKGEKIEKRKKKKEQEKEKEKEKKGKEKKRKEKKEKRKEKKRKIKRCTHTHTHTHTQKKNKKKQKKKKNRERKIFSKKKTTPPRYTHARLKKAILPFNAQFFAFNAKFLFVFLSSHRYWICPKSSTCSAEIFPCPEGFCEAGDMDQPNKCSEGRDSSSGLVCGVELTKADFF